MPLVSVCENLPLGFPNRSYTKWEVQPQKMARGLMFQRDCTIYVAKIKALISCAVTTHLICAFVFAFAMAGFLMTQLISHIARLWLIVSVTEQPGLNLT